MIEQHRDIDSASNRVGFRCMCETDSNIWIECGFLPDENSTFESICADDICSGLAECFWECFFEFEEAFEKSKEIAAQKGLPIREALRTTFGHFKVLCYIHDNIRNAIELPCDICDIDEFMLDLLEEGC